MRRGLLSIVSLLAMASTADAFEIGHYVPGIVNIRDFAMPRTAGFYVSVYNFYYQSGRVNDLNGKEVQLEIPDPVVGSRMIDPDVDAYMLTPVLTWVTDFKLLGARYGAVLAPNLANTSLGASLAIEGGRGVDPITEQLGFGDLYVQPLWLGWELGNWDVSAGWGFYAPTGKYHTDLIDYPGYGPVRLESIENIGLGFWTNQFQAAVAWYPFGYPACALTLAATYEINSEKEDFHLTPGQNLAVNWGASQYLPLRWFKDVYAEIGPAGYDSWQVTSDEGQDARNGVLDQVHAAGFQVGLTSSRPWTLNFHYLYEYHSEDRFQGHVVSVNASMKI